MEMFSDITEISDLNTAKQLLKESREGFLTLFNNNAVCMSMTDLKRTYVKVNRKFQEKLGYTESEIIGKTSKEVGILDEEESKRVGSIIAEKGGLQNDYVRCIAKSGKIVHAVSSIERMEMNGEIYLVSFFLDISKIVEQRDLIEKYVKQLEMANKELETFSYSVSHDLKAPLRAIDNYMFLLNRKISTDDEEVQRMINVVHYNAKKMGNLIDDLLSFARLERTAIEKKEIDMNVLVNEVLADQKENHRAEIKTGPLYPIQGDYALIKQVMINLISNGIKYSSKKEFPVVEITSEKRGNEVCYMVTDNGIGFDMKYVEKLFGVFQRLHNLEEFEGTGVGLAIVQRIIAKHGGHVKAEGKLGEGARFSFVMQG